MTGQLVASTVTDMLGAIIGDIAGSIYEGTNHKSKDFRFFWPGADFTDDTVCPIAVADALRHDKAPGDTLYGCTRYPGRGYGGVFAQWLRVWERRP